jgi:hypothetical protein
MGDEKKIYVISCNQDLMSMGIDRVRTGVDGLEETEVSLDWSRVRFVPIIASEKVQFNEGDSKVINIEPIKVPAYSMVIGSYYGVNGVGFSSCIGCLQFKQFNEDRVADKSMFHARVRAPIMPGDLLGQAMIVPVKK